MSSNRPRVFEYSVIDKLIEGSETAELADRAFMADEGTAKVEDVRDGVPSAVLRSYDPRSHTVDSGLRRQGEE